MALHGAGVYIDNARKAKYFCRANVYGYNNSHDDTDSDGNHGATRVWSISEAPDHGACGSGDERSRGHGTNAEASNRSCTPEVYVGSRWRSIPCGVGLMEDPPYSTIIADKIIIKEVIGYLKYLFE